MLLIILVFLAIAPAHAQSTGPAANAIPVPGPSAWTTTPQSLSSSVWQRQTYQSGPNGTIITNVHRVVEIGTGLNRRLSSGQYARCNENVVISPDGSSAMATNCQYSVVFPGDIYNGIRLVMPDGREQQSQPLAIGYFDGTNSILLAAIGHSTGAILPSGTEVLYTNALIGPGLNASLLFKCTKAGIEQNVLIQSQPEDPGALGLSGTRCRLQMITEFISTPQPKLTATTVSTAAGNLESDTIDFGSMRMAQGKAFLLGTNLPAVRVSRHWTALNSQRFLIEEVPVVSIAKAIDTLPPFASGRDGSPSRPYHGELLAALASSRQLVGRAALNPSKTRFLAQATPPGQGLVLDYQEISGFDSDDFTFEAGTTYYISDVFCPIANVCLRGGAVIKYPASGLYAAIDLCGTLICQTDPFHPAIFTEMDDNSAGEVVSGSTGTPVISSAEALMFDVNNPPNNIENAIFRYCSAGVDYGDAPPGVVRNCQFIDDTYGIAGEIGSGVRVENALFYNISSAVFTGFSMTFCGDNVTVHNAPLLANNVTVRLTNSLFICVPNLGQTFSGAFNQTSQSDSGVFQSFGSGEHNLPSNSPYIDQGNTTADTLGLYWFTTQTSQAIEGVSTVDLGYHYPPVDGTGNPLSTEVPGTPDYISDANGNGLPDSWEANYFGTNSVSASTLDGKGQTLLYDYQNNVDPTVINFSIQITNNYVRTHLPVLQASVQGVACYQAVCVDDPNYFADANWTPYTSSNITVNLGSTEGWHDVWIGLKAHSATAYQAWTYKHLKVDLTPPWLTVTNPITDVISQPMIELQGHSPEPLAGISYDIANDLGLVTDQQILIVDESYDTTLGDYTTNNFQAFDVPLTNGLNTITIHATDLAGNVMTTNLTFTLDYSGKTTPPAVQLYWPQDGAAICGSSFTWRGHVDDFTATLTAQMVDGNGDTQSYEGIVERDGNFWIEGLPVGTGTTVWTLTATDAAGNSAQTEVSLSSSNAGLTINQVTDLDQLWNPTITVTGTIADSTAYTVWVNGMEADPKGGGSWEADNVPLPKGGTAVIQARAIPNTQNGGNGTGGSGGGPVSYDNIGNPGSTGEQTVETAPERQPRLYMTKYNLPNQTFKSKSQDDALWTQGGNSSSHDEYTETWTIDITDPQDVASGSADRSDNSEGSFTACGSTTPSCGSVTEHYSWPGGTHTWTGGNCGQPPKGGSETGVLPFYESVHCDSSANSYLDLESKNTTQQGEGCLAGLVLSDSLRISQSCQRKEDARWVLQTGGKARPGKKQLWAINGSAQDIPITVDSLYYFGWVYPSAAGPDIPFSDITINGNTLAPFGYYYITLPDAQEFPMNLQAHGHDFYTFSIGYGKYHLYIRANGYNLDTTMPTFCVGQQVNFVLVGIPADVADYLSRWTLPGDFVNEPYQYSSTCDSYRINWDLLQNTLWTSCWFINKPGGTVGMWANLHFSNGQYVSVAVDGNIDNYRPRISGFNKDGNQFQKTALGLQANMLWDATFDSAYNGYIGVTQIISCSDDHSDYYTAGYNLLDGSEIYGEPDNKGVPKRYDTSVPQTHYTLLGDYPIDYWHPCADMIASFKDYLRFQPDGGIFVTIATVDWHMNGDACPIGPISPNDIPPAGDPVDSDAFPLWELTR